MATSIANLIWRERSGETVLDEKGKPVEPFQPTVMLVLAIQLLEASGMSPEQATKQAVITLMMEGKPKTLSAMRKRFAETSLYVAKMTKGELQLNPGRGPYVLYNNNPETPVIRTGTLAVLLQDVDSGDVPFFVYTKTKAHTKAELKEMTKKWLINCNGVMRPAVCICREVMYRDAEVGVVHPRDESDPEHIEPAQIRCTDCNFNHMFFTCEDCVERLRVGRLKLKEPGAACYMCTHELGGYIKQSGDLRDDKTALSPTKLTGRIVKIYIEGEDDDYEYKIVCDVCRAMAAGVDFPIVDDVKEIPVWRFGKSRHIGDESVADREDLLASLIK